jgi:hypothetical protein
MNMKGSTIRAQAQTHNLFFARQKWFLTLGDIQPKLTDFCPPFFDIRFYSAEIRSTLFDFPSQPANRARSLGEPC